MTKEFILANFCFGSPPLLIPPRPQVLLRALNIVLFGIDEKEAPKLNTSAGTILALQRKHNSKVYVRFVWFQEFSFFHYWLDYKQFWCWRHSRKVLFWLHNWICQIASPNASPSACLSKTWPSWWWGCRRWRWTPRPERLSEDNLEDWGVCPCQRWKNAKVLIL